MCSIETNFNMIEILFKYRANFKDIICTKRGKKTNTQK